MNNVLANYSGKKTTRYNDGTISVATYIYGKRNGLTKCWYKNGETLECSFRNDIKHGIYLHKFKDGSKKYESEFIDGFMEGPEYSYNSDGKLELENYYYKGQLVHKREYVKDIITYNNVVYEINEIYTEYYRNEVHKLKCYKLDGQYNGPYTKYDQSGSVIYECIYNNGIKSKLKSKINTKDANTSTQKYIRCCSLFP